MQLEKYKSLINSELSILEEYLEYIVSKNLKTSGSQLQEIINYVSSSKGKRIRAVILLLLAKSFNENSNKEVTKKESEEHKFNDYIKLAALIELLHTATLLHDDVIDESKFRRNKITVNYKWNDVASMVAGDWLLSIIFQILIEINNWEIFQLFSQAFNALVSGELEQLKFVNANNISYDQYIKIITKKTAILFELATAVPAVLNKKDPQTILNVKNYGFNIGLSFQMTDDILDYLGDPKIRGKEALEDLNNGKLTLPLIELIKIDPSHLKFCKKDADTQELLNLLTSSGAIQNSISITKQLSSVAIKNLETINDNCYTEALTQIAELITERLH